MSLEKMVSDYIQQCASSGVRNYEGMHAKIKEQISDINEKLGAVDYLRIQRSDLQKIEAVLSSMLQTDKIQDSFDDTTKEMQDIRSSIIEIIKNNPPLSNREIMHELCKSNKDAYGWDAKIIRSIKYLAVNGIIEKNSDRKVIKGSNW